MNKRTDAREVTFKLIFEYLFLQEINTQTIEDLASEYNLTTEKQYVDDVYFGIVKNYDNLIAKLQELSVGYKIDRIYKVDKAILLVSMYEINYMPDIPFAVSINEALNLAKKYSTEKSHEFINGILSKVVNNGNN